MAIVKTDSQHYSDIAAAIRSKSGGTELYKPQQMPDAILGLETGTASSIVVYAPSGSEITLSCGDTVRTVPENDGVWLFSNCGLGSWLVTAQKDGMTASYPVEIQEDGQLMRYVVQVAYTKVYGILRDITNSSPEWTRTDNAVGMTASASVGTVAGYSDFDSVYPWGQICRETMSTGDVMVKIPKFWYRRYRDGNMESIQIADKAMDGFSLHPAFCHGGVEREAVYVGAYMTNSSYMSASGYAPLTATTRPTFRTNAQSKGAGWGIYDIAVLSAIQMLILVEFATYNSQTAIGYGYCKNSASSSKINTGTTDDVPNLTGVPAGTDGQVDVVWRGLEGLWGNVYEYVDGVIMDVANENYYICNDPALYVDEADSNYTCLTYQTPTKGTASQYITELGYQEGDLDYVMLPTESGTGSDSTYVCDAMSLNSSGNMVLRQGGRWYSNNTAGLFQHDATCLITNGNSQNGCRLVYIPQEVTA